MNTNQVSTKQENTMERRKAVLPRCILYLIEHRGTIGKEGNSRVLLAIGNFAIQSQLNPESTMQLLSYVSADPDMDIAGLLNTSTQHSDIAVIDCAGLRSLASEGITVCDKEQCPFYRQAGETSSALCSPQFHNAIFIHNTKYCRYGGRKNNITAETLSNFIIQPVESITVDGTEEIVVNFISETGYTVERVILPPETWTSRKDFLTRLPGMKFSFVGNDREVQLIKNLISQKEFPSTVGYKVVGLHKTKKGWVYLTNEGAINKDGKVDGIVYRGNVRDFNSNILSTEPIDKAGLEALIKDLASFNHPNVVAPLLGWTVALFFKPRIYSMLGSFPILAIFGEPGSGKTETIKKIVLGTQGLTNTEKSLTCMTSYTMMHTANASNCLPLFMDEFKPSKMENYKRSIISEYMRASYNGLSGDRGRQDQTKVSYSYSAPTVIAGEDRFIEPAVRERIIEIQFSKGKTGKFTSSFENIQRKQLTMLGRLLLEKSLRMTDEEIQQIVLEEERKVDSAFNDRFRRNVAIARLGLRVLDTVCIEHTGQSFPVTPQHMEESQKETLLGDSSEQGSIADKIVEAILSLIYQSKLNDKWPSVYRLEWSLHYYIKGKELRLHLSSVYPIFLKWARDYDFDGELLTKSAFLSQVKNEDYFVGYKTAQMSVRTTSTKRCLCLNIQMMDSEGIETHEISKLCTDPMDYSDIADDTASVKDIVNTLKGAKDK